MLQETRQDDLPIPSRVERRGVVFREERLEGPRQTLALGRSISKALQRRMVQEPFPEEFPAGLDDAFPHQAIDLAPRPPQEAAGLGNGAGAPGAPSGTGLEPEGALRTGADLPGGPLHYHVI